MSQSETSGMSDITAFAPTRVILSGVWRIVFGALIGSPAVVIAIILLEPRTTAHAAGEAPGALLGAVGAVMGLIALALISGGIGRIVSAFSKDCYLRAGPAGMAVRLPVQGWFGRFKVKRYEFAWNEIAQIVHFTYRTNGIPTATELRVRLRTGTRLRIERQYFAASIARIQDDLLAAQASAGLA